MTIFRFKVPALLVVAALSACGKVAPTPQSVDEMTEMGDRLGNIEERLDEIDEVQANLVNQVAELEDSKPAEGNPVTNMQDVLDRSNILLEQQEKDRLNKRVEELERHRLFGQ